MSKNRTAAQNSISIADKLQRQLDRIQAAQRKKFLDENIVRLEKNGDLSLETIRTYREGDAPAEPVASALCGVPSVDKNSDTLTRSVSKGLDTQASEGSRTESATITKVESANPQEISNWLPNKLPESPASQEIGNIIAASLTGVAVFGEAKRLAQDQGTPASTTHDVPVATAQQSPPNAGLSCHEAPTTGSQSTTGKEGDADPLTELLHRAVAATKVRPGRPASLDDQAKGQLIALLSVGMSMRQAASVLGVSHTTVQKALKADPSLAEEITAARFQAQLQPLACIIREARRSWKAATWLLKYLDTKISTHEETPDERRERPQRQTDEFLARSSGPHIKTRHVFG
jgi:hypothetical protein